MGQLVCDFAQPPTQEQELLLLIALHLAHVVDRVDQSGRDSALAQLDKRVVDNYMREAGADNQSYGLVDRNGKITEMVMGTN